VNAIKDGLTEKKNKIDKIEKGLAVIDTVMANLNN
jgi:hypothetical protein